MIKCEICEEEFRYKTELARHIDSEHSEIGQVEYYKKYISNDPMCGICLVCNKPLETNGTKFKFSSGFRRKVHKPCSTPTYDHWICIYGKELGEAKWKEYCNRQSETNTFEYKQRTYGWTLEEFNTYNKTRAITLDNMILKYGIAEGEKVFNEYVEKQRNAGCSLSYFQEKYGIELGLEKYNEVNNKKRLTLENFIKKYGETEGKIKYNQQLLKHTAYTSKIATEFFEQISDRNEYIYYGDHEFGLMDSIDNTYYCYDYVDTTKKKIIEFNGDYWHPKSELDENFHPFTGITAKDAWEKDRKKEQCAINKGYKIYYIWEHEVLEDIDNAILKCKEFLNAV